MANNEKISKRVVKVASKLLKDPKSHKKVKSVAGSALTLRPDRKIVLLDINKGTPTRRR